MNQGEISLARFSYRASGTAASIIAASSVSGPMAAVSGSMVAGGFYIGEVIYDGINIWINEVSKGLSQYENAIKNG